MYVTLPHWRSQKFCLGSPKWKNFVTFLMTFFGDIMAMTSLKWRHNWFFHVRFCHNQLEKTKLGHVTQLLGNQNRRLRGAGGGELPALGDFW